MGGCNCSRIAEVHTTNETIDGEHGGGIGDGSKQEENDETWRYLRVAEKIVWKTIVEE